MENTSGAESVIVTGSALSNRANSSPNPVQIISSKQIEQTGATSIGDFLQRMPSMGASGTNNSQTNGSGGVSAPDLRNLGQNRVLVLIDGKRTAINGLTETIDLNTIAPQQVASIEILKDGGSELYGADAVSGVINIKLKHDVNYGNITIRGGITDRSDNETGMISGIKGWDFDHGRGNFTMFGSYTSQSGVRQRNRSWAQPVLGNDTPGNLVFGSGYTPQGRFGAFNGQTGFTGQYAGDSYLTTNNGGQSFRSTNGSDRANYGYYPYVVSNYQNSSVSADSHYEIDRHFDVYGTFRYSHRTSNLPLAPEPMTGAIPPSNLASVLEIPANYPGNSTGQDLYQEKRMAEFGPRQFNTTADTYTGIIGTRGDIYAGWKYDLSYSYGWNKDVDHNQNIGNYANLMQVYGLRQVDPSDSSSSLVYDPSVCQASTGCSLSSPFGRLSPQSAAYANYNTNDKTYYQLRDLNLRIHNDKVVKMPWQNGGNLGIALGMEHRGEQLSFTPDPLVAAGQTMTNTASYTGGGFNVTEGYIEGSLNLLKNAPFAHDLTIDGQGRVSSYNTFGSTKNWKAMIDYAPTRDIRFRGTLGTSYRQPNVNELYGGVGLSYNSAVDPCAQASSYGGQSAAVQARCASQGINTSTFSTGNFQVPTLVGGNSQLQPETSRAYTFGTVLTPRWTPGLTASVEYWHYNIQHVIGVPSTQYIMDSCYTGTNPGYCNSINRLASSQQISTVSGLDQNLGALHTSGIDFSLEYRLHLTRHDILDLTNEYQQLLNFKQQYTPGGQFYNYTGTMQYQATGATTGSSEPRVRDYATLTYQHNNFSITWMMQYTGGMLWNDGTQNLTYAGGHGRIKTPGIFQHDISVNYALDKWNFSAGVENVFDKQPPFVVSATDNSFAAQYGGLYMGRYIFAQAGVNF